MSKANPLVGLIGYGDSDESDDEVTSKSVRQVQPVQPPPNPGMFTQEPNAAVHPAPIPHCAWSACYDEGSGFTYYWNQHTNAVTWEAPQEYLMALKLAQHQLNASGSAEVSAEEWQLYQQALADKQKPTSKTKPKLVKPAEKPGLKNGAKRKVVGSDDETEKIELIDSYHNSDSESNDEDSPVKTVKPVIPKPVAPKNPHKKQKTKPQERKVEYGPSLPANQNYTIPIGPELPPGMIVEPEPIPEGAGKEEKVKSAKIENEDSQDESALFKRLKDKAKLLEKLGGEIPSELQKMIQEEPKNTSPKIVDESSRDSSKLDIDDLLSEIEQKELPKIKSKKIDMFGEELSNSGKNTPTGTPPREFKPLFPSSKAIEEAPLPPLPPPVVENGQKAPTETEKKPVNVYLADSEVKENRKKLRIDNSLLPDRKKSEVPAYTTKYSQFIEGFSSERTGLGFKEDEETPSPKAAGTINYGNGLMFTKGEVLNEDKRDEDLDEMSETVEAKLKFFNEVQPCAVGPVQEMLIQFQTLVTAFRSGALTASYWRRWVTAGEESLRGLERRAAPPGWTCTFQRSEGRYRYRRESDGLTQWEYPAAAHCDMEICTTPPPEEPKVAQEPPPLPPLPPLPPPPAPSPPSGWARASTPPPPAWHDPPPPGCDEPPPLPPVKEPKKEIGDELLSFYSDIAELEKTSGPHTATNSPEPPPPEIVREAVLIDREKEVEKEKEKDPKVSKKKSKVKISASIGMKHKTVSSMVAKWQQVADEIHSD